MPLRLGSFIAGVTDGPVLVRHDGSARCLQVDMTALGARQLLGMPMCELANESVPIDAVLGRFGRDLVQRVGEAPDWPTGDNEEIFFAPPEDGPLVDIDGMPIEETPPADDEYDPYRRDAARPEDSVPVDEFEEKLFY